MTLGDRSLFPDLQARVYLNHSAISPPSTPVLEAARTALDAYARLGTGAWLAYREQRDRLRSSLARLMHAEPADVALVPSTSRGLADLSVCIPWQRGDRIVVFEGEFPSNVSPWQAAARAHGLELLMLPAAAFGPGGDGVQQLEQLCAEPRGVRLIAVSAVQFQTGLRMPLDAIVATAHAAGAEVCVDAIQALGIVPIDVRATPVDYLVAGSHKWLMGLEGCAVLYVAPRRVGALRRHIVGWLSHEDGAAFLFEGPGHLRYDRPISPRADFLEVGAQNVVGCAALEASVALVADHGVAATFEHVQSYLTALEAGCVALGFESLRAPETAMRSGILALAPPADVDLAQVWEALGTAGIACSMPDGLLRFAPHWPNAADEVDVVVQALRDCLPRCARD